jgi:hypothetical protein
MVCPLGCNVKQSSGKDTEKDSPEKKARSQGKSPSNPRQAAVNLKSAAELKKMADAVKFPPLPQTKVISLVYGAGIRGGIEPSG